MGLSSIKIQQSISTQTKTAFIMLTLIIQPSFIHCCGLAQLYMDLQKATCLETIQDLEFTISKKTSKAGSIDGQPCKHSSLAERPPWLPLNWSPTFSQPQLPEMVKALCSCFAPV